MCPRDEISTGSHSEDLRNMGPPPPTEIRLELYSSQGPFITSGSEKLHDSPIPVLRKKKKTKKMAEKYLLLDRKLLGFSPSGKKLFYFPIINFLF